MPDGTLECFCSQKNKAGDKSAAKERKGEVGESLDFVEEGPYDVLWALVVVVWERLGDEFLVD